MTHLDLFSGIGGFTLAAHWAGFETIGFCEINPDCRRFLERAWPGIPIHDDIKTLDGRTFAGVSLLTAGVPCQPASRAGKQRGKEDDRWLWPQALRVLGEARPTWAVFENPPGIGDVGLAGILAGVESQGYEVRVFSIPACAVGAPHRRERYWIVAHRYETRRVELWRSESGRPKYAPTKFTGPIWIPCPDQCGEFWCRLHEKHAFECKCPAIEQWTVDPYSEISSNTQESGGQRIDGGAPQDTGHPDERGKSSLGDTQEVGGRPGLRDCQPGGLGRNFASDSTCHLGDTTERERESRGSRTDQRGRIHTSEGHVSWNNFVWLPCADGKVRRAPDDSFGLVDGLHRSILAALGNSIVPKAAYQILKAIVEAEE